MDAKQLDDWEALAKAATEGPWVPKHLKTAYLRTGEVEHEVRSTVNGKTVAAIRFRSQGGELGEDVEDHDVAFIAAARAAVPALVDEVRRLRARQVPFELDLRIGGWVPAKEAQAEARRSERERCAKALCGRCAEGIPFTVTRGEKPWQTRVEHRYENADLSPCDAAAIRTLPDEPSPEET